MPWLEPLPLFDQADSDQIAVPSASGSETSLQGAKSVLGVAGGQCAELLALYQTQGPLSDHQVEARLVGWPPQRICARRGALMKQGRVRKVGQQPGPFGPDNNIYGVA